MNLLKTPFLTSAVLLAAAGGFAAAQVTAPQGDWKELSGTWSGISRFRKDVIQDDAAWKAVWAQHEKGKADENQPPKVDFTRETVVGVFLGACPTSRPVGLMVARNDKTGEVVVQYVDPKASPRPGGYQIEVMATPFEIVKLPKAQAVRFAPVDMNSPMLQAAAAASPAPRDPNADQADARVAKALAFGGFGDLRDSLAFDGASAQALPPPPGQSGDQGGKSLPPPPGQQQGGFQGGGKPLPPPPGQGGDRGGKPLPPPPGQGDQDGKPLPPPPAVDLPRPIYPGGPLPHDERLRGAERAYDTTGMTKLGYWDGDSYYKTDSEPLNLGPNDANANYLLRLKSTKVRQYNVFFYSQASGKFYYVPGEEEIGSRAVQLQVAFVNRADHPLLPWEREQFIFSYKPDRTDAVRIESQSTSYNYDTRYVSSPQQPGLIEVQMAATNKLLTPADRDGVTVAIAPSGNGLKLIVKDRWGGYYALENLEITLKIKKDSGHWYKPNPVVFDAPAASPIRVTLPARQGAPTPNTAAVDLEVPVPVSGSGTYNIDSWSFRRAASKVSNQEWIYKGGGNKITR